MYGTDPDVRPSPCSHCGTRSVIYTSKDRQAADSAGDTCEAGGPGCVVSAHSGVESGATRTTLARRRAVGQQT